MTRPPEVDSPVILLCRDPGRCAILRRLVRSAEVHSWPVEVVLAVARRPARAVIINLEDFQGSPDDILAALQRGRPGLPVYAIVAPEEEPLGRRLLRQGAADYFVLPGDINRLPRILSPKLAPPDDPPAADPALRAESAPGVTAPDAQPPPHEDPASDAQAASDTQAAPVRTEAPVVARSPQFQGAWPWRNSS